MRPGETLSLKLLGPVDASKQLLLRLTGPEAVQDVLLQSEQVRTRVARILPPSMKQGTYATEIVTEQGDVLAAGTPLTVLAPKGPVISRIAPRASYKAQDMFEFELAGENFSPDAADDITINDVRVKFANRVKDEDGSKSVLDCQNKLPCLIGSARLVRVIGLSAKKYPLFSLSSESQAGVRPMSVAIEVAGIASKTERLVLSPVKRSTPAAMAFLALAGLVVVVYALARRKAQQYKPAGKAYGTLEYLFIDPETNTYSLSRLQLILWTAASVVAYIYLGASQFLVQWNWGLPTVPEGLPTLLGLSAGTSALAIGASAIGRRKGAGPVHPQVGDFITTGGVFAPERLQFLLWTMIGVTAFVSATLIQDPATVSELPKIPDNFLPLMGVSSLGYLAGKYVRKSGPAIRQVEPSPPFAAQGQPLPPIRIIGDQLSPQAQVLVYGSLVPASAVKPAPGEPEDEFVHELIVTPTTIDPVKGAAPVKLINPDGQSAELGQSP
jgi:hypothetical protein